MNKEEALNNLGWTLFKKNHVEQAIESIKKALTLSQLELKEDQALIPNQLNSFKGKDGQIAIALGNIAEIGFSKEMKEDIQAYWLTLGLKCAEQYTPEYLPRQLLLLSKQYRAKKQVLFNS